MEDNLESFLNVAEQTFTDAVKDLAGAVGFLSEVDSLYVAFLKQGGGIKPATASILLLNAHASVRAAIRLALSGQLLPVFMTLRGSIESALYANGMAADPAIADVWLHRDQNAQARQACRDVFTVGGMLRAVAQRQDQQFADLVREIYDASIDFGAHPNSRSLLASTHIEELPTGDAALNFAYLHGSGSFEVRQSLLACAETGLVVFFLSLICYPEHPESANLNERALAVQARLPELMQQLGFGDSAPRQEGRDA